MNINSPNAFGTVRANIAGGTPKVSLDGTDYNLLQFHFHSEAEHEVNGYRAPMELHFVNSDSNGNLLVVGRFIEIGAFNSALDTIFSALPQNPGDSLGISGFDLSALLPSDLSTYRYDGSLTTPNYAEGVKWNVFVNNPLELSQAQVDAFRALFPRRQLA